MNINKLQLLDLIANKNRENLLQYLGNCMDEMNPEQLDLVFGDLYYEKIIQQLAPDTVLEKIKTFLADSLAGKYYAPFNINSKNYSWIPPETDAWYSELSTWLDRSCELVQEGQLEIGEKCLDICFELIDKQCDEIVFADEIGDWMITADHDYEAIYQQLKSTKKQTSIPKQSSN